MAVQQQQQRANRGVRGRLPLLKAYFSEQTDVVAAYLFGSYARNGEDHLSDVDIAVLLTSLPKEAIWRREMEMADRVCDLLQTGEIDFVVLNTVPLRVQFEIISTGRLLQSNNEARRTDFEVAVMSEYWDFKKYDEEYDDYLLRRLKRNLSDAERQEYHAALGKIRQMSGPTKRLATTVSG
jgi:hypothetical protein